MDETPNDSTAVKPTDSHVPVSETSEKVIPLMLRSWQSYETSSAMCRDEAVPSISTSPRSEYYRLMYACLQEKYDYVQASTDRLRDRLYHVKKEVTYLKRMKRVLIRRLARYGESYSYAPLEIPDNIDIEDPAIKKRKERRERERERKEALRAAKVQKTSTECKLQTAESRIHLTESENLT